MKKVFLKAIALAMALVLVLGSALVALSEDGTQGTTEAQQDTPAPVVVTPAPEPTVNEEAQPVENTQAPTESNDGAAETETPAPSDVPEGELETPVPTETPTETAAHPYLRFQESNGELTVVGCDPTRKEAQIPAFEQGLPVMHIGESAFENCLLLETVEVAEGVKTIGKMAFAGCESLRTVILPKSIEDIATDAFADCGGLQAIEAPEDSVGEAFAQSFFAAPAPEGIEEEIGTLADNEADAEEQPEAEQAVAKAPAMLPDPETSIELSGQLQLGAGKSTTLKAIVTSETTIDKTLTWTSSKPNVATVSPKGVVTAKKITTMETVEITATLKADSEISATVEMTIAPLVTKVTVAATDQRTYLDINLPGDTIDLAAKCEPEDKANQTVAWKSSNTAIASVNAQGKVTVGTKTGAATITATAQDGSGKAGTIKVTVVKAVETVSLPSSAEVAKGKSVKLTPTFTPADATNKNLTWISSDPLIATVVGGTVKGVSEGTVTITATSVENLMIFSDPGMTLTVTPAAALSVAIAPANGVIDLSDDDTLALSAAISPPDASQNVVWQSSNPKVATVDSESGVVTGKAAGKAVITATTQDGSGKKGTTTITVLRRATGLSLQPGPDRVAVKKTITLKANVEPSTATNKAVVWSTSDPTVAKVSNGVVTGVAKGDAIITATAKDGSGKSDSRSITVLPQVQTVAITTSESIIDMSVSDTLPLTLTVEPSTAKQQVLWKSSNTKVATVDSESGVVTGKAAGTTTITATAQDGSGKKATKVITVLKHVIGVSVTGSKEVAMGKSITLKAVMNPVDATNKAVTWKSDNPNITVSTAGVVKPGRAAQVEDTAIITATSKDGGHEDTLEVEVTVPVKTVTISAAPAVNTLDMSEVPAPTLQLTADTAVTWKSSSDKIAKVDAEDGLVTAVKPGVVTITATARDGSGAKDTIKITVTSSVTDVEETCPVAQTVAVGKSITLTAKVAPSTAVDKKLTWTSSDSNIAKVSATGVVTGVTPSAPNTPVIITATNNGHSATFEITVKAAPMKLTIAPELEPTRNYINLSVPSQSPLQLTATVLPAEASQKVTWKSSNPKVATVEQSTADQSIGIVTALKAGSATITATTCDGSKKSATFKVTVFSGATGVTLSGADTLVAGSKATLSAAIVPSTANKTLTWTSSDPTVATVDAKGVVTAKAVDAQKNVTITAASKQDPTIKNTHLITVFPKATNVSISAPTTYVAVNRANNTLQLTANFIPADASQGVTWRSSNPTIASVDATTGLLTARKLGTVTVTATTTDGSAKIGRKQVQVITGVTGIAIEGSNHLGYDKSISLISIITPSNATYPRVIWTSSDEAIATVDQQGNVTANAGLSGASGYQVTITATSDEYEDITASHTITVNEPVQALTLGSHVEEINLLDNPATYPTNVTVQPSNACQILRWESSDSQVVTVDSVGTLTAVGTGTATISAHTTDGTNLSQAYNVTVYRPMTGLTIQGPEGVIGSGMSKAFSIIPTPADATDLRVIWSIDDASPPATISTEGVVTAAASIVTPTTITVRATSMRNATVTNTLSVTLYPLTTSITITGDLSSISPFNGPMTRTLTAAATPSNAYQQFDWTSSRPDVATVDENGVVTGISNGRTTVTATAKDGSLQSKSVLVGVDEVIYNYEFLGGLGDGVKLTKYVGNGYGMQDAVIPATYAGELVLVLGESMLKDYKLIKSLTIPEGITTIEANAFAGCSNLVKVTLPASLTDIHSSSFAGASPAIQLICPPDSYALTYAKTAGTDFKATNTVYRALVIGQQYWGNNHLSGPFYDTAAMEKMLSQSRFAGNQFTVARKIDLTKSEIRAAISSTFAGATENDVSLFFYSGHGDKGGKLVGYDFGMITPAELRGWLDTIPGRKIVIVDACYSGAIIGKDISGTQSFAAGSSYTPSDFTSDFTNAFAGGTTSSGTGARSANNLADGGYYVMTAASGSQLSYEAEIGFFTYALCYGCGWDGLSIKSVAVYADTNGDGIVTLQEAYVFAKENAAAIAKSYRVTQTAQVYPLNSYFGLLRK